jgi:purine-nucleoside phosphorylase
MSTVSLDEAVSPAVAALVARKVPRPDALLLYATGLGMMTSRLKKMVRVPLGKIDGVPPPWRDTLLHAGYLDETPVWLIEDAPGPPEHGSHMPFGEAPWVRGYPCWLAAAAGAPVCVHASAGLALERSKHKPIAAGSLALVSDHINVSGKTPLIGLGDSKLGPLFPDQSRLHLESLRKTALKRGKKLGVPVVEAVAACTPGPAVETPAERAYWAKAGADIAVQGLATPLLASAHAGLAMLAIVCITDGGEGIADVGAIVRRADEMAPALEDLVVALAPDLHKAANELGVEEA